MNEALLFCSCHKAYPPEVKFFLHDDVGPRQAPLMSFTVNIISKLLPNESVTAQFCLHEEHILAKLSDSNQ